jgi:putative membrane protein
LATNAVTGEVKESAKALQKSAEGLNDSADRRTELAADRTVLAAERTYASWVQLGLASLAAGVGAKKVMGGVLPEWLIVAMGTMLVLFSAFCFVAAVWRQLRPGAPPPRPDVQRIPPALLGSINGFLILVDLFAIIGIWIGRTGG